MSSEKKTPAEHVRSWLPLIYLIVALLALRWTIVEPYVVPTGSMEPTLKPGDRLYALKCAYDIRFPFTEWVLLRTGAVKRGDVILFRYPKDPGLTYVKRALGIAGDKIRLSDGVVYINGQEVMKKPTDDRQTMYDIENADTKTLYIETIGNLRHYVILDRRLDESYEAQLRYHRFCPVKVRTSELMPSFCETVATDEVEVPPGYLFAVGDNRDNSADSRSWGFVPIDNLKGRAMFIWYSSREWFFSPRTERIGTLIQ